jgi:hypothetical protein
MTLTSSPSSPLDIHHSFRVLKERIRRRWAFEYLCVTETTSGCLLHLHIAFRGGFIPQGWISVNWEQIHGAPIVWVSRMKEGRGAARYLAKYLGKEVLGRFWSSWGWIYRGWAKNRRLMWKAFAENGSVGGFPAFLKVWRWHLRGGLLYVYGEKVSAPI